MARQLIVKYPFIKDFELGMDISLTPVLSFQPFWMNLGYTIYLHLRYYTDDSSYLLSIMTEATPRIEKDFPVDIVQRGYFGSSSFSTTL